MSRRSLRCAAAFWAAVMLLGACTPTREDGFPDPIDTTSSSPSPGTIGTGQVWRRISNAPTVRQEVAAAAVGGRIYVVGGLVGGGGATDVVEIYDPASDSWMTGPRLPVAVHHGMVAEHRGTLVALGGFLGSLGGDAIRDVYILEDGRWRKGPPLRRARAAAAAVTVGDEVVVVGGISGGDHVAPVEIFDGSAWRDGAPIPTPRDHLAAANAFGFVFAAGGRAAGKHFDTFEGYDPQRDVWETLAVMPTARSGLGGAFAGGRVVFAGGEGPRMFPEVEAYDKPSGRWTRLPGLAVPVHGVGLVGVGSDVYALVGGVRVGLAPSKACQVLRIA